MYDAGKLEAINLEQLVTATDRLLMRGGRRPGCRTPRLPSLAQPGSLASVRPWQPRNEQAQVVRGAAAARVRRWALSVVIPMLAGVVVGLGLAAVH